MSIVSCLGICTGGFGTGWPAEQFTEPDFIEF